MMSTKNFLIGCLLTSSHLANGQIFNRGVGLGYEDVIIGRQFAVTFYQPVAKAFLLHAGLTGLVSGDRYKDHGLSPDRASGYYDYAAVKAHQRFGLRLGIEKPLRIRGTDAWVSPFATFHANRLPAALGGFVNVFVVGFDSTQNTLQAWSREDSAYLNFSSYSIPRTVGTFNLGLTLSVSIRENLFLRIGGGVGLRRAYSSNEPWGKPLYGHIQPFTDDHSVTIDRILTASIEYKFRRSKSNSR